MKRYLGLDLGTTSLGMAISDKTNTIVTPLEVLKFKHEDYESVLIPLEKIINENKITDIVIGLPKNMDNSLGFAAQRSMNFKELLSKFDLNIHLYDERLTTIEALNILKSSGTKRINEKNIVDAVAASLILEGFLKGEQNG